MISERLLDIREDASLNQQEMAEILKTTQSNYSRWETGTQLIPLEKLNLLCNYFNVSMDFVIGLTRNKDGNGKHTLDPKVIGKNIRTLRSKNNITQKDLAELLNTTQSTISAYESGKNLIIISFVVQIINEYKVSLDWLCGRIK